MALSAEDFLRVKTVLLPSVVTFLDDLKKGADPRAELKAMFQTTGVVRRDVQLRLGLEDGALTPSEFNECVDVAYSTM